MHLQTDRAFAAQKAEDTILVVLRMRTGFAVPMTDFQIVNPGGDYGEFANTPNAGGIPVVQPPDFKPLLRGAGVFVNVGWPFQGAWVGASGETVEFSVSVAFRVK